MKNTQSFTFFDGYFEAISELNEKEKKDFLLSMVEYVFEGKEPSFKGVKNALWVLIKPSLDVSIARSKAKQNKIKSKSNQNQNEIKTKSENEVCPLLDKEKEIEIENNNIEVNNKCCNNNNYSLEKDFFDSNNIFITPATYENFYELCETYSFDWIKEAVNRACKQNNRNLNYVSGILRSWKNKGFANLEEIKKEFNTKESLADKVKRTLGGTYA